MLNKQGYKVSQGVLNNFSQASPPTKFELGIRSDNLLIKSFKIVFQSSSNSYFYPLLYVDRNNKRDLQKPSFRKCGSCFSPFSKVFRGYKAIRILTDYFFILQWSLDCHDLQDSTRSVYLRGGRQSRRCDLFLTSPSASPSQVWPPTLFYYVRFLAKRNLWLNH